MYSFHDIAFYSGELWHFCCASWVLPREIVDGRVVNRISTRPVLLHGLGMHILSALTVGPMDPFGVTPSVSSQAECTTWHGVSVMW